MFCADIVHVLYKKHLITVAPLDAIVFMILKQSDESILIQSPLSMFRSPRNYLYATTKFEHLLEVGLLQGTACTGLLFREIRCVSDCGMSNGDSFACAQKRVLLEWLSVHHCRSRHRCLTVTMIMKSSIHGAGCVGYWTEVTVPSGIHSVCWFWESSDTKNSTERV